MSRHTNQAKDHYNLSLQQYKKGEYLEAVKSIDKAISFGYRDVVVYDVKAAALSKLTNDDELVWRDQAMDVIQHMCKQWGEKDWRPWHRKAEYLRSRRLYSHALTAIDKALEVVDAKNRDFVVSKQIAIRGEREAARIEQDRRMATASAAEKKAIMEARRAEAKSTKDFTQLISPDVLLLITDHLLRDKPSIGCRLSAVCHRWRDILYERPGVWSTLVLGKTRPVLKVEKFIERTKGKLRKLKLLPTFDFRRYDIADLLEDHVGGLVSFEYAIRPRELIEKLEGKFVSLEHLTQTTPVRPDAADYHEVDRPDRGLMLDGRHPTLRSLSLQGGPVDFSASDGTLARLRELTLRQCLIINREQYLDIFTAAPLLERIDLHGCSYTYPTEMAPPAPPPTMTHLPDLITYTEHSMAWGQEFRYLSAPNLVRLELSDGPLAFPGTVLDQIRGEGLASALPNLQVLDISGQQLDPQHVGTFLEILSDLSSLRFLNISFAFFELRNDLLQALTWRDRQSGPDEDEEDEDLLPNLEALSIAGLEINSIPLRDLVLSRLPRPRKTTVPSQVARAASRSAFMPSSAQSQVSTSPANRPTQRPSQTPSSEYERPSQLVQSPSKRQRRACLKWLCVDHCTSIDDQLPVYLATKLPFVSHSLRDRKVEDRIKGRGRYSWELDYYHSCADEGPAPCTVERVEGTMNDWRLVHHCGLEDVPYEPEPKADVVNIWESQWDPPSTQADTLPIPSGKKPEEPKGWAKVERGVRGGDAGGFTQSGRKRPASGAEGSETGVAGLQGGQAKARKGKERMKISIGPNGSLTGF